jgi:hypothetical protein
MIAVAGSFASLLFSNRPSQIHSTYNTLWQQAYS